MQRLESTATQLRPTYQLVLSAGDVWYVHIVGRRGEVFELAAVEDVEGNKMDLGVAVLASLRSRHVNDLARTTFDHNVAVLPKRRALHGKGGRRTGIGGLEGDFMLLN